MSDNTINFQNALLEEHNKLRAKYGNVKPLALDETLNKLAKEHADYLASKQSKLENSKNDLVGENLYYLHSIDGVYTAKQVMDFWLKRSDLVPNTKPNKTSHFTQIVWKSSKKLGIGASKAQNGAVYICCFYEPRGNVTNYLNHNVIMEDPKFSAEKKETKLLNIQNIASKSNINNINGSETNLELAVNGNTNGAPADMSVIVESLEELFKMVDKNKSGKVSLTKTKKLFQQINQNFNTTYTSADAKRLFEKCSKNEEGAICLEDFKKEFPTIQPTHHLYNINNNSNNNMISNIGNSSENLNIRESN